MREASIKLFLRLCALLPLRFAHAVGSLLGGLFAAFPNRSRHVARTNLALCFPDMDERERNRLAGRSLRETGKTMTETGALWLWDPPRVLGLVRGVTGVEQVDAAMAAGKGVILTTPHLGNWEMVGLYCSSRYPLTSLYRPPRMQGLEDFMRTARERLGAHLVPTDAAGLRALYRALARGEAVGILPDQEPRPGNGVFAPFFGVPAYSMTLLPRLAQKSGAPVFVVWAERLPGGKGFHLRFMPAGAGFHEGSIEEIAAHMNAGVEACVRQAPAQYQWAYKRFNTRPDGEPRPY